MIDDPFMTMSEVPAPVKEFGVRGANGRYHMPLLPGELGPKSVKGADYVSGGIQSVTNLVGAFEETRALSVWEQALALVGLALSPELYEELVLMVHQAVSEGMPYDDKTLRAMLAGFPGRSGDSIIGKAKDVAKADAAARKGTNRHTAWEHRGATGELIGTLAIQEHVLSVEELLERAGLERVPGLSERVVRNLEVDTCGRFDDILLERSTGRLLMSDLKTKATAFYSWMTVDAQLATYAHSQWMLAVPGEDSPDAYVFGPLQLGVDLTEGVILHVPSDGGVPRLERADLVQGWETAKLARQVTEHRSAGKSADRHARSAWVGR